MNDATIARRRRRPQAVGREFAPRILPVVASQVRARFPRLVAIITSTVLVTASLFGCSQSGEQEHPGKAVYERYCYACHQAGIADAPKLGDRDAWAARLAKPREELLENIKRGMTPGMPPRGGCPSCTDEALETALDYIVFKAD